MNTGLSVLGVCLAIGLGLAGYFGGQTVVNGRTAVNTATVKGLAERIVPADLATWDVSFNSSVSTVDAPDLEALYTQAGAKERAVLAVLQKAGVPKAEIFRTPLAYRSSENRNSSYEIIDITHTVYGRVRVTTTDLERIAAAHFAMAELPRQGTTLSVDAPAYQFTGLNALKPEMLREATKNARIAADEFARDAGVSVGGIQSATQGGFSVRDAGSDQSETESPEKTVRVVTTITFYLRN